MNVQRDLKVVGFALKGKAKTPTVTLESRNGEKLTLKFESMSSFNAFEINQEFTLKLGNCEQTPLLETETTEAETSD